MDTELPPVDVVKPEREDRSDLLNSNTGVLLDDMNGNDRSPVSPLGSSARSSVSSDPRSPLGNTNNNATMNTTQDQTLDNIIPDEERNIQRQYLTMDAQAREEGYSLTSPTSKELDNNLLLDNSFPDEVRRESDTVDNSEDNVRSGAGSDCDSEAKYDHGPLLLASVEDNRPETAMRTTPDEEGHDIVPETLVTDEERRIRSGSVPEAWPERRVSEDSLIRGAEDRCSLGDLDLMRVSMDVSDSEEFFIKRKSVDVINRDIVDSELMLEEADENKLSAGGIDQTDSANEIDEEVRVDISKTDEETGPAAGEEEAIDSTDSALASNYDEKSDQDEISAKTTGGLDESAPEMESVPEATPSAVPDSFFIAGAVCAESSTDQSKSPTEKQEEAVVEVAIEESKEEGTERQSPILDERSSGNVTFSESVCFIQPSVTPEDSTSQSNAPDSCLVDTSISEESTASIGSMQEIDKAADLELDEARVRPVSSLDFKEESDSSEIEKSKEDDSEKVDLSDHTDLNVHEFVPVEDIAAQLALNAESGTVVEISVEEQRRRSSGFVQPVALSPEQKDEVNTTEIVTIEQTVKSEVADEETDDVEAETTPTDENEPTDITVIPPEDPAESQDSTTAESPVVEELKSVDEAEIDDSNVAEEMAQSTVVTSVETNIIEQVVAVNAAAEDQKETAVEDSKNDVETEAEPEKEIDTTEEADEVEEEIDHEERPKSPIDDELPPSEPTISDKKTDETEPVIDDGIAIQVSQSASLITESSIADDQFTQSSADDATKPEPVDTGMVDDKSDEGQRSGEEVTEVIDPDADKEVEEPSSPPPSPVEPVVNTIPAFDLFQTVETSSPPPSPKVQDDVGTTDAVETDVTREESVTVVENTQVHSAVTESVNASCAVAAEQQKESAEAVTEIKRHSVILADVPIEDIVAVVGTDAKVVEVDIGKDNQEAEKQIDTETEATESKDEDQEPVADSHDETSLEEPAPVSAAMHIEESSLVEIDLKSSERSDAEANLDQNPLDETLSESLIDDVPEKAEDADATIDEVKMEDVCEVSSVAVVEAEIPLPSSSEDSEGPSQAAGEKEDEPKNVSESLEEMTVATVGVDASTERKLSVAEADDVVQDDEVAAEEGVPDDKAIEEETPHEPQESKSGDATPVHEDEDILLTKVDVVDAAPDDEPTPGPEQTDTAPKEHDVPIDELVVEQETEQRVSSEDTVERRESVKETEVDLRGSVQETESERRVSIQETEPERRHSVEESQAERRESVKEQEYPLEEVQKRASIIEIETETASAPEEAIELETSQQIEETEAPVDESDEEVAEAIKAVEQAAESSEAVVFEAEASPVESDQHVKLAQSEQIIEDPVVTEQSVPEESECVTAIDAPDGTAAVVPEEEANGSDVDEPLAAVEKAVKEEEANESDVDEPLAAVEKAVKDDTAAPTNEIVATDVGERKKSIAEEVTQTPDDVDSKLVERKGSDSEVEQPSPERKPSIVDETTTETNEGILPDVPVNAAPKQTQSPTSPAGSDLAGGTIDSKSSSVEVIADEESGEVTSPDAQKTATDEVTVEEITTAASAGSQNEAEANVASIADVAKDVSQASDDADVISDEKDIEVKELEEERKQIDETLEKDSPEEQQTVIEEVNRDMPPDEKDEILAEAEEVAASESTPSPIADIAAEVTEEIAESPIAESVEEGHEPTEDIPVEEEVTMTVSEAQEAIPTDDGPDEPTAVEAKDEEVSENELLPLEAEIDSPQKETPEMREALLVDVEADQQDPVTDEQKTPEMEAPGTELTSIEAAPQEPTAGTESEPLESAPEETEAPPVETEAKPQEPTSEDEKASVVETEARPQEPTSAERESSVLETEEAYQQDPLEERKTSVVDIEAEPDVLTSEVRKDSVVETEEPNPEQASDVPETVPQVDEEPEKGSEEPAEPEVVETAGKGESVTATTPNSQEVEETGEAADDETEAGMKAEADKEEVPEEAEVTETSEIKGIDLETKDSVEQEEVPEEHIDKEQEVETESAVVTETAMVVEVEVHETVSTDEAEKAEVEEKVTDVAVSEEGADVDVSAINDLLAHLEEPADKNSPTDADAADMTNDEGVADITADAVRDAVEVEVEDQVEASEKTADEAGAPDESPVEEQMEAIAAPDAEAIPIYDLPSPSEHPIQTSTPMDHIPRSICPEKQPDVVPMENGIQSPSEEETRPAEPLVNGVSRDSSAATISTLGEQSQSSGGSANGVDLRTAKFNKLPPILPVEPTKAKTDTTKSNETKKLVSQPKKKTLSPLEQKEKVAKKKEDVKVETKTEVRKSHEKKREVSSERTKLSPTKTTKTKETRASRSESKETRVRTDQKTETRKDASQTRVKVIEKRATSSEGRRAPSSEPQPSTSAERRPKRSTSPVKRTETGTSRRDTSRSDGFRRYRDRSAPSRLGQSEPTKFTITTYTPLKVRKPQSHLDRDVIESRAMGPQFVTAFSPPLHRPIWALKHRRRLGPDDAPL